MEYREKLWQKLKKEYDDWVAAQPVQPIVITLPDGKEVEAKSWRTTPYEIARGIRYVYLFGKTSEFSSPFIDLKSVFFGVAYI